MDPPSNKLSAFAAMYEFEHVASSPESIRGAIRGGALGLIFAGHLPLASKSPYPIIVYSVANYRPRLGHFWANILLFAIPT